MSALSKNSFLKSATAMFSLLMSSSNPSDLFTPPLEALKELERRRKDPSLQKKIEAYLGGDIPDYYRGGPILYLARHIVTPNFETLRFIHLVKHLNLHPVISQDSRGLFVTQNEEKRALCKLPVCRRITQKDGKLNELYQYVTVVDFSTADGKRFCDIDTLWDEKLIDFHTRLFSELKIPVMEFPDDADWLDRHHRGDLFAHYKELLSLFVVHGIFFENYNMKDGNEAHFVKKILRPACRFVEERFGYKPLITRIFPTTFESYRFWMSYPNQVIQIARESMNRKHLHKELIAVSSSV